MRRRTDAEREQVAGLVSRMRADGYDDELIARVAGAAKDGQVDGITFVVAWLSHEGHSAKSIERMLGQPVVGILARLDQNAVQPRTLNEWEKLVDPNRQPPDSWERRKLNAARLGVAVINRDRRGAPAAEHDPRWVRDEMRLLVAIENHYRALREAGIDWAELPDDEFEQGLEPFRLLRKHWQRRLALLTYRQPRAAHQNGPAVLDELMQEPPHGENGGAKVDCYDGDDGHYVQRSRVRMGYEALSLPTIARVVGSPTEMRWTDMGGGRRLRTVVSREVGLPDKDIPLPVDAAGVCHVERTTAKGFGHVRRAAKRALYVEKGKYKDRARKSDLRQKRRRSGAGKKPTPPLHAQAPQGGVLPNWRPAPRRQPWHPLIKPLRELPPGRFPHDHCAAAELRLVDGRFSEFAATVETRKDEKRAERAESAYWTDRTSGAPLHLRSDRQATVDRSAWPEVRARMLEEIQPRCLTRVARKQWPARRPPNPASVARMAEFICEMRAEILRAEREQHLEAAA